MRKAYTWLAWGLLLEMIDVRIQSFDIFPDVIGYFLLLMGISRIRRNSRYFNLAFGAAGIQLLLSIAALLGQRMDVPITNGDNPTVEQLGWVSVSSAVELVMLFGICSGIGITALKMRKTALTRSSRTGWRTIFAIDTISLLLLPFLLNMNMSDWIFPALLLSLASWISNLWVIFLVRRAGRELSGGRRIISEEME